MQFKSKKLISRIHSLRARDINAFLFSAFAAFSISSCTLYPEKLDVKYLDNACLYPVIDYLYSTCSPMRVSVNDKIYLIPSGFKTDLASIPRGLWWLYAPHNTKYVSSAIMHDFMYSCDWYTDRLDADNVFYYSLLEHGVKKTTAYSFWVALRMFGWISYKEGDTCTERFVNARTPYKSLTV